MPKSIFLVVLVAMSTIAMSTMSGFNNSLISVTNAQEYGKEIRMDSSGLSYNVVDQKYGKEIRMDSTGLSYNVVDHNSYGQDEYSSYNNYRSNEYVNTE